MIPTIRLGTFGMRGDDGGAEGIRVGNHLLDNAYEYQNEAEVGEGVRTCGVARSECFVTETWDSLATQ